jgi:hypothetical protein
LPTGIQEIKRNLSKSKLISYRQCPKRLWLEIHHPDRAQVSAASEAIFRIGHQVGGVAQRLYDPAGTGALIDLKSEGIDAALARTATLLESRHPIFEAGFASAGAMAFSDVLLPVSQDGWRMVEVKASGSVKNYQRDDVAIQSFIARKAGVQLNAVALAHIDTSWVYPGGGDYRGLLMEVDLTEEAFARTDEVQAWIAGAHAAVDSSQAPDVAVGKQCQEPFECAFLGHCDRGAQPATHPVEWLPRVASMQLKAFIADQSVRELSEVPDHLLNALQKRVRDCTVAGNTYFDAPGAKSDLAGHVLPGLFLDFETISFAVPIWAGTRPFQQITFQFSVHRLEPSGTASHRAFLDLTGEDPSRRLAEDLVATCGVHEPVFVYNAGFEGGRLAELAGRYTDLAPGLLAIKRRLVDLWPIAVRRYYHPKQQGSWSIKKLLPALVPALRYEALDGVADGGAAQGAYMEAIQSGTSGERRSELRAQLLAYCKLDTWAMVEIWNVFAAAGFNLAGSEH